MKKILIIFTVLIISALYSCLDCKKCSNEVYADKETPELKEAKIFLDSLNLWLEEPNINDYNYESYRLIYVSSFNDGRLIRFEKEDSSYFFIFKNFSREYLPSGFKVTEFFEKEISKSDWKHIEELIYKYHFWTAERYKSRVVADSYGLILEGRRPEAKPCGKKTDQIVIRGSPDEEDEIGILFNKIMESIMKK